ncbi:PREDICTED: BRI3-binding protein [Myotis davidii]|uniref:BRI3-binding protein n=1 Tax=Myotis davidii TaxID=225400 RepID=UPI000766E55F|nr:PREDICTED: BRI3-binding protein [Myotis davidii]
MRPCEVVTEEPLLARLMEKFVHGVDVLLETLWKVWMELLDVLGLDVGDFSPFMAQDSCAQSYYRIQFPYLSPASVASSPARALVLVGLLMLAYWFLSLTLGFAFSVLHLLFGRFFWAARVALFSMACVYVLHKYEGEPEGAALPLCLVVASDLVPDALEATRWVGAFPASAFSSPHSSALPPLSGRRGF